MDENPPAVVGHTGSIPVWEDPTLCGAAKPIFRHCRARVWQLLKPALHNKRNHLSGKTVHHSQESLPVAVTRESLRAAMKTQCNQKINTYLNIIT